MKRTQTFRLEHLVPTYADRQSNPNKLDEERYQGLKALMQAEGGLQPILVWSRDGKPPWRIIDGHHRYWIALELGWTEIEATIFTGDEEKGAALSLAMNRLRGELDLTLSAEVMRDVLVETFWDMPTLALMTGFTQKETEALLNQAPTFGEANLGDLGDGMGGEDLPPPDRMFTLEVAFETKEQLKLVRKKLKKAAGASKDLAQGLLNVLGETNE